MKEPDTTEQVWPATGDEDAATRATTAAVDDGENVMVRRGMASWTRNRCRVEFVYVDDGLMNATIDRVQK